MSINIINPEDDEIIYPNSEEYNEETDEMKREYPGYSDESYNAGLFIGTPFPYVPGDPGL